MTGAKAMASEERTPLPPPLVYLKRVLNTYYRDDLPKPPARFGRREFGFIFWPNRPGPPPFVRHMGFRTRDDFGRIFTRRTPWHAYYSTAFYQHPTERRMQDKGWLGAELIFDLDADHLPGADAMSYREQMRAVKVEFQKLLDEFIFGDLGFDEKDVFLTFSGGRGYHCHVVQEAALTLDARARRQVADYVTGKGVSDRNLIWVEKQRRGRPGQEVESAHLRVPAATEPGWRGRVGREVVAVLSSLRDAPREEALSRLQSFKGIGPKGAEHILDKLRDDRRDVTGRDWIDRLASGMGDQHDEVRRFLAKEAVQSGVVGLAKGETDEPVTADVKRLIRLPDSLHGKSGLRVVPLTVAELASFDPLVDAVALPMDVEDEIVPAQNAVVELSGETFRLSADTPATVPRAVAFFAVARRLAVPA